MSSNTQRITGYGVGAPSIKLNPPPIISTRDPTTNDTRFPLGQEWVNKSTASVFALGSVSAGLATWVTLGGGSGAVATLTGNSGGAVSPLGGNINIVGAGALSFAGAGSTLTGTITPGTLLASTLTGNSGGAISPTAGNFNILGNNALGVNITGAGSTLTVTGIQGSTTQVGVWESATAVETGTLTDATRVVTPLSLAPILVTPFVVAPGGAYTTIQSAINAAIAAGGVSQCVMVRPGTYTEDLDFSGATALTVGLTLLGATALGDEGQCEIIGTHIPPASGTLILRNFRLSDATAIFSSAGAGSAHLVIIDAELNVTNGYTFDLPNWTGIFELFDINPGTANDGGINNPTGGATLFMFSAGLGMGTGQTMQLSGTVVVGEADIGSPVNFATGSVIAVDVVQFSNPVTFAGNSTGQLNTCRFTGGASAAITMSSTAAIAISQSVIQSSNNPAIAGAGAGTLTLGGNTFTGNALLAGTLTVAYASIGGVLATKNTPGASPQIVNARTGQVAFTDTIANGAYGTLTMTNSTITAASVIVASVSCTTVNSACQIVETTPGAGSVAFRIFNAGAATTAADIQVNFWVIG